MVRAFHHADFDAARLVELKHGRTISVCLPARNEAATVGDIVATIRRELVERVALVDEIVVLDDHSEDHTAELARRAGATVYAAADLLPEHPAQGGKGDAMWRSLYASSGDLVAWCDADIRNFGPRFVIGLLGPLLTRPDVTFVKGYYDRPFEGKDREGGRVTELVARPLVSLLFPNLTSIVQPLSGEYAGRRDALETVPFMCGYGVDLALLVDLSHCFGTESLAQVDLGTRVHRNRPLDELSPQALAILQTALRRAGVALPGGLPTILVRPGYEPVAIEGCERPPLVSLATYRGRRSA